MLKKKLACFSLLEEQKLNNSSSKLTCNTVTRQPYALSTQDIRQLLEH